MGCCQAEPTLEQKMSLLMEMEQEVIARSGLPVEKTECKYTTIEMENREFKVRTFVVGGEDVGKKTLVFTHGFIGSMVMYFGAMSRLANKYRLVMFDNCCKGLNTKF